MLNADSWIKNPDPVFQRSNENGVFGPGHNGFFTSPDGKESWIVYHANSRSGDVCLPTRTTRAQKFTWNADGSPNFGVPVATTMDIPNPSGDDGVDPLPQFVREPALRLKAFDDPTKYINHFTGRGKVTPLGEPARDFEFALVKGLADESAVSLESIGNPGSYLINRGGMIWLSQFEDTDEYRASATWWQKPGLASADGVSFESFGQAGAYLFHQKNLLNVKILETDADKAAATFIMSEMSS